MKSLYLIRHAKSDWGNESLKDVFRPLNARGYNDAHTMSMRLKDLSIFPDIIISSPAIRAFSTALIFSNNLGYSAAAIVLEPLLYESNSQKYFDIVSKINNSNSIVFLFAHNPTISEMAQKLNPDFKDELSTCAILSITKKANNWKDFSNAETKKWFHDFPKKMS